MAVGNSLVQKNTKVGFTAYLTNDAVKDQIAKVVGGKDSARFISSIISAVQVNPALQECENSSILSAALQGEVLKLPPSPQLGYFYMVPFKNKKKGTVEAQFILSAKGYKQLAMRSGQYVDIDVIYVREGEYIGRDKFSGKQKFEFIEDDDVRESLPIIGYLAYFETVNGFKKSIYWTKQKMEKHADRYSQAFSIESYRKLQAGQIPESDLWKYSSYWYTAFDEMAEKTMIRQLLSKWAILSTDIVQAMEADNAIINSDGSKTYVETLETESSPVTPAPVEVETPAPKKTIKTEVAEEPKTTPTPQPQDAAAALFGQ